MNNFRNKLANNLKKPLLIISMIGFLFASFSVEADCKVKSPKGPCASEVKELIKNDPVYHTLYKTLYPFIPTLTTLTHNAVDQASYEPLLAECLLIASLLPTGRVVVADSDGLVAVDTGKSLALNTYANYQYGADPSTFSMAINVNHNSRVSILDAQLQICGVGVETKFSNSVGAEQNYVAIRLGNALSGLTSAQSYLNNDGTARISVNAGTISN